MVCRRSTLSSLPLSALMRHTAPESSAAAMMAAPRPSRAAHTWFTSSVLKLKVASAVSRMTSGRRRSKT